jgi:hypothetical protein
MKKFINFNSESVEYVDYKNNILNFYDLDVWVFSYYNGEFKIIQYKPTNNIIHYDLFDIGRENTDFPGRLWANSKVISFWKYPKDIIELYKIISDINNSQNKFKIDDEWLIEIIEEEIYINNYDDAEKYRKSKFNIIPIIQYKKSKSRTKKELNNPHKLKQLNPYKPKQPSAWKKWMKPFEKYNNQYEKI